MNKDWNLYINQKFFRLTVNDFFRNSSGKIYFNCYCECGKVISTYYRNVLSGQSKSCGCYAKERVSETMTIHGKTNTRIYRIWQNMIRRCVDKNIPAYKNYGGHGIVVCDRWMLFENFYDDMSSDYSEKLYLDRIDNNKNYSFNNCRWSGRLEQANNKRNNLIITIKKETKTLPEWCRSLGLNYHAVYARMFKLKWSLEQSLELI